MLSTIVSGLLISFSALGFALANNDVFESIEAAPRGWAFHSHSSPDEPITLTISVKEQNYGSFEQLVLDISDPDHAQYGRHLEAHEVANHLKPREEASQSVIDWLETYGVTAIRNSGEWIDFRSDVATAESMLSTRFGWYTHESSTEKKLRTTSYSVPKSVSEHLNFISPTIKFPSLRPLRSMIHPHSLGDSSTLDSLKAWISTIGRSPAAIAPPNAVCNETITPQCLLNLYNVHYQAPESTFENNTMAYASFLDQYARYTDLTEFSSSIASYTEGRNFSVIEYNGGMNNQESTNDSTEANLDNQYQIGVADPIPVTEFSTGGCGPQIPDPGEPAGVCDDEPYLAFLKGILAMSNADLPKVLSLSYGDDEQAWPENLAKKVCNMFSQLGGRGVSVFFASGDNGPGGGGGYCENNAGTKEVFVPSFPATCPFVTTVGATQYVDPEEVASFSGGGFSNYFARPSYQESAVAGYLKFLGTKFSSYYNHTGRGFPDVAAQGVNFLVVNTGITEPVDGTSAATPTFASIVAILNAARASQGTAPLGFLNPLLYGKGLAGLTDITIGASTGCSTGKKIAGAGWASTTGWDPATGLGTPDFGKLLGIVAPGVANSGGVLSG